MNPDFLSLSNAATPTRSYLPPDPDKRHILSLSGGKDSTALALYLRDLIPQMEYAFCDTGEELPETYEYLDRLEVHLARPITRLNPDRLFSHHLDIRNGYLPSSQQRWCTELLKLKPFEKFVGDDPVVSYVGIRADENRSGYISTKPNIQAVLPFKEDGLGKADIARILENSGLGLPDYYRWRSRSGCYFCFFQQRNEWIGLLENHPDLFEEAKKYEKQDEATGKRYTWNIRESLDEVALPERVEQIKVEHQQRLEAQRSSRKNRTLLQTFGIDENDEDDEGCLICHL